MRMSLADSNPNYFYDSPGRKSSHAFDGKKKCPELDCIEFFAQGKLDSFGNIGKKTKSEMYLIDGSPTDAADARIKRGEDFPDRLRRIN